MEIKTVIVNGLVYQIGMLYHFGKTQKGADEGYRVGTLIGINDKGRFECTSPYQAAKAAYNNIAALTPGMIGTIEDEPIELISGEYYKFVNNEEATLVGQYDSNHDCIFVGGQSYELRNITVYCKMGMVE